MSSFFLTMYLVWFSKKVLEVTSKTSLVVLVDDPLISQQLGKFLNQIQSGLMQGSATFGMKAPRASLLISSNSKEVERVAGRVIRFNYTWDEAHSDNEGGRETQLLDFMDNNKGLFVAWAIRYLPLWEEIVHDHGDQLRSLVKKVVTHQQPRWVKGTMYCIMVKIMIHASANKVLDIKDLLSKIAALKAAKLERPPFFWRIQQDALDKLNQDGPGKVQYVVVENEIIV
ncbi:uncharacterized protein [Montipora capricornis]|uniref:uncharacterized protein isoform X1 n=1 Tax=Montipora capricornis TaxID=246305 RepID=UPI0035F15772